MAFITVGRSRNIQRLSLITFWSVAVPVYLFDTKTLNQTRKTNPLRSSKPHMHTYRYTVEVLFNGFGTLRTCRQREPAKV
eukprot:13863634-Ditylum_brightwellii.AAC.1